jgi:hypothetical protein
MKPLSLTRLTILGTGLLLVAVGRAEHSTPGQTTTTLPSSTGAPVVMTSPGPPANPNLAGGVVHHVVTGEITDVDRNSGRVDIRASDGSKVQSHLAPVGGSDDEEGRPRLDRCHDWAGALEVTWVTADCERWSNRDDACEETKANDQAAVGGGMPWAKE